ncbi:unnamed protein product, partial [Pylaiella littoralis]
AGLGLTDSVLRCLERGGWEYSDAIMATAAREGHLHLVEGLRARGYPCTMDTCRLATWGGHLELLKWCLFHGCPWSWPKVVDAAHASGFVAVVKWCNEVG